MSSPSQRILVVDDDEHLLEAIARTHRKSYRIQTACGPEQGLQAIERDGPFAVVVSDYMMPGTNGISFLSKVRQRSPDTVRIMLTGKADFGAAIEAVNRGQIFRFLTKPCSAEVFEAGLNLALEQYRLIHAERSLLEDTLRGCVQVLADVLAMTSPTAFGRAMRLRSYVQQIAARMELDDGWQLETAALLSQIGCVAVPESVLLRRAAGQPLGPEMAKVLEGHAETARRLLAHVPRLEAVADGVAQQGAHYTRDGGSRIPLISRVLRVAIDFDAYVSRGQARAGALAAMRADEAAYDPHVLAVVPMLQPPGQDAVTETLPIEQVRTGMILDEDLSNGTGGLVVARGHEITTGMLERLRNYAHLGVIRGDVRVRIPVATNTAVSRQG